MNITRGFPKVRSPARFDVERMSLLVLLVFAVPMMSACLAGDLRSGSRYPLGRAGDGHIRACMGQGELETEILRALNRARARARWCGLHRYEAAGRVRWNERLARAALVHSVDMASHHFFSHMGSDGSVMADRLKAAGYRPLIWGENLARGQKSVREVVDAWLRSPAHCSNIMLRDFTETGAACVMDREGRRLWTILFAAPLP